MGGLQNQNAANFSYAFLLCVLCVPLAYLHVFPFAAREGPDAAALPDRVAPRVVKERSHILRALSREKSLQFRRRFEGRVLPGLTVAAEEGMGESVVLTDNYIHARGRGLRMPPNRLVQIRIDELEGDVGDAGRPLLPAMRRFAIVCVAMLACAAPSRSPSKECVRNDAP